MEDMSRAVEREASLSGSGGGSKRRRDGFPEETPRVMKREGVKREGFDSPYPDSTRSASSERSALRSRYLAVKNIINVEKDDITRAKSELFSSIFCEVETLHHLVQKPREQVADAEALLDIANTLVSSVKCQTSGGLTPAEFVTCLFREFGQHGRMARAESAQNSILWKDIGLAASTIFRKCRGCPTMVGPMNYEVKRGTAVLRKHKRFFTQTKRPDEVKGAGENTDTDKNMSVMFDILKEKKTVTLESLVLNGKSFAQTVENLFALSFLVKDGRVEIFLDDKGSHFVSPKNAPSLRSVTSGKIAYSHFAFRLDFSDWKLMVDLVPEGYELMPHRSRTNIQGKSQADQVQNDSQSASRNGSRSVQDHSEASCVKLKQVDDLTSYYCKQEPWAP